MSKLNDQRVAITKRIMELKDHRKLTAIAAYLDDKAHLGFSAEEVAGFEGLLAKHRAGAGQASNWSDLRKRLRKRFPAKQ